MEALAFHSFLQFQTHINSPSLSQLSLKFAVANSYWLIQQILAGSDYSEKKHRELQYDTLPKDEVRLLPFKTFLYVTAQEQTHVLFSFFPFLFQLFFVDLFQFIRKIDGAYFRSEWLQFFFFESTFLVFEFCIWRRIFRSSRPVVFLEHPCQSAISINLQSNFIKITLWHRYSRVNLLYIFRTPFP